MATLSIVAAARETESVTPLPWRRMAWVTWRQHRVALIALTAFLGALSLFVWIAGLHLHSVYGAAIACRPTSSFTCEQLVGAFNGTDGFLSNGVVLQLVPAFIGAFLGAPVLAREMETGTFRFAWTQGFGRWRWALAKLVALAVAVVVATSAISVLFSWYYQPYFARGNENLSLTALSKFAPGLFDLQEITLAAWTLVAFAIGAVAGMLIRRVVPAIVATLAVYSGLAVAAAGFFREHYLTPLVTTKLDIFFHSWVLNQLWTTKGAQPVSQSVLGRILQGGGSPVAGKGGVPQSLASWRYLVRHGYTQWTSYQPGSRFWPFQLIEGGWLIALSVLLIALAVSLVRRPLA
jgi:hypothetical protein